ncbi:MAG: hypothetical protein ACI4IK_02335 [Eubacterium sp.]
MDRLFHFLYKLLCYFLSVLLAFCLSLGAVSAVLAVTVGNENFTVKYFSKDSTVSLLTDNLDKCYQQLSDETDIPKSVFVNAAGYDFIKSVQRTVIEGTQTSASLDFRSTTDIENRFTGAIKKYDEESSIKRSNKERAEISRKAVEAFNSTCAIVNNRELMPIASFMYNKAVIAAIFLLVSAAACAGAEIILNGRRHKSYNYIATGLVASGEMMIIIPLIVIFSRLIDSSCITNIEAYNIAIRSATQYSLYIIIAIGTAFLIAGILIFAAVFKYYQRKLLECDTETEIERKLIR